MLPLPWVDRIFDKLVLAYGRDFTGRWEGLPLDAVKNDWAHELRGFATRPEGIKHALQNLPAAKPPTVFEFRNAAASCPQMAAIELPPPPADKEFTAMLVAKIGEKKAQPNGMKQWAHDLMARHKAGEKLNHNQVRCYRAALGKSA